MAEKLGPFLDIDRHLAKAALTGRDALKNRINLVGVELEGGWTKLQGELKPARDGSVFQHGFNPLDANITARLKHVGEIPLPPLSVREFPTTMKLYYPHYVDQSCGMHVHLSTTKAFAYQRLMINRPYSYPGTIIEYIKRWAVREKLELKHPIWSRLRGESEYCQHLFQADEQAKTANKDFDHHRPGHRYTVVHFCWGRYKTVECRLLPMMQDAEQGVRAVQEVINITNAFLAASKEREPRLRSSVVEEADDYIVERRSYA